MIAGRMHAGSAALPLLAMGMLDGVSIDIGTLWGKLAFLLISYRNASERVVKYCARTTAVSQNGASRSTARSVACASPALAASPSGNCAAFAMRMEITWLG